MRQATITVFFISVIPLLSGCGGCSPTKHDSPEAAFDALQEAAQEGDWETAMQQMTEQSQAKMAGGLVFGLGMMAAFDPKSKDEVESLLKEHGLDPDAEEDDEPIHGNDMEAALKKMTDPIEDKPAFIADAIALMKKLNKKEGGSSFDFPVGKLEDLKVDGNSATAVIVVSKKGKEEREPVEFRKVDGGWLVHIPDEALGGNSSSGNVSVSASSGNNERMGRFDEELPEPDNVPEQRLSPSDLSGLGLEATISVSGSEPDGIFESFPRGTQFATITLKGQPVRDAYQYGQVQVEATDNAGQSLNLGKPLKGKFGGDLGNDLVKLDHFFLDSPDEIVLHMGFTPASETKEIARANGTIKLKVRTSVHVENLPSKIGKSIDDPALQPFGDFKVVAPKRGSGNPNESVDIICKGDKRQNHKVMLVDRDGNVVQEHAWRSHGDDYTRYTLDAPSGITDETQLKIVLSGSERILVVPFQVGK